MNWQEALTITMELERLNVDLKQLPAHQPETLPAIKTRLHGRHAKVTVTVEFEE